MNDERQQLVDKARSIKMTPAQEEAQRRSFAYGNTKIEDPTVTRKSIDEAAAELDKRNGKTHGQID